MVGKRSGVKWWHRRLLYAGFFAFALLALAAPSGAGGDYDSAQAAPGVTTDECRSTSTAPASVWDRYDSKDAGHPLRIAAYLLHPVGVIVDWVIFRPAWWIGSHEPFYTLFGRTD